MFEDNSLFDKLIDYCHNQYIMTACAQCDHRGGCPNINCGNCKQCLEEVHFPNKHSGGRKDYDCERMINFYVCDYAEKYASEMLYLIRKSKSLEQIDDYHVLSIGCGSCPDLMALERYCIETGSSKTISYVGVDVNELWKPIHGQIESYHSAIIRKKQFLYYDAVTDNRPIKEANVIILQYVISHFYNNGQISQVNAFFQRLVSDVIARRNKGVPMAILINDVNSCNRGRNYFMDLVVQLENSGFDGNYGQFYFNYNILDDGQRYGEMHETIDTIFKSPDEFEEIYKPWHQCSSAQLLIEVM